MLPIQRRYADVFCGEQWTPLVPTLQAGVYASLWEASGLKLWTLVNRTERAVDGDLIETSLSPGERAIDLIGGREVARAKAPWLRTEGIIFDHLKERVTLRARLDPRGIGCCVAGTARTLGADFPTFLESQRRLAARASIDVTSPRRVTELKPVKPTRRSATAPDGMVEIPAATITLSIEVRERECGFYESSPAEGHRWKNVYNFVARRFDRTVSFRRFAIDEKPVTNTQFAEFIRAAKYRPRFPENFLKHWRNGAPPPTLVNHPVVHVALEDARAYARWAGKRLPTEEEWQYAAQGADGRRYPWGNELLPGRCNSGETGGTTAVDAFPAGRSPFGVLDQCGNVWEWTESERSDGRTRFCLIRGGSFYTARGSGWYMDGGARPADFAEKFLLTWPGLDRCATMGFRCALDLT